MCLCHNIGCEYSTVHIKTVPVTELVTEVIRRELLTDDLVMVIITVQCDFWAIGLESKFRQLNV